MLMSWAKAGRKQKLPTTSRRRLSCQTLGGPCRRSGFLRRKGKEKERDREKRESVGIQDFKSQIDGFVEMGP